MKKFITIILALGLLHTGASAQWYLYPGGRNEEKQEQTGAERQTQPQKQTRPERRQTRQEQAPEESVREPLRQLPENRTETGGRNSWFSEPLFGRQSGVSVTLALPIGAGSEKPNANFLEMYSGALLALKDLGDEGVKVRLKLVDTASGGGLTREDVNGSDLIIGPVSYNEMLTALTLCDNGKVLVSPLDPKTAKLAETSGIIQAPSSWTSQIDELVEWVQEDLRPEDQLIVVADPDSAGRGEQYRYLLDRLHGKVLDFRTVSSVSAIDFIEGRTCRMLIASDSDSFLKPRHNTLLDIQDKEHHRLQRQRPPQYQDEAHRSLLHRLWLTEGQGLHTLLPSPLQGRAGFVRLPGLRHHALFREGLP